MDDCAFDQMLERLMKLDFSAGTETFRDALLKRCQTVLDASDESRCLEDADLELLAAAGATPALDPFALEPRNAIGHNRSGGFLA